MSEFIDLLVNGEVREVEVLERGPSRVRFRVDSREYLVEFRAGLPQGSKPVSSGSPTVSSRVAPRSLQLRANSADGKTFHVLAPSPGVISEILVAEGDQVEEGQLLLRLEAMKMQNAILAPRAGKITKIDTAPGKEVMDEEVLLEIESSS